MRIGRATPLVAPVWGNDLPYHTECWDSVTVLFTILASQGPAPHRATAPGGDQMEPVYAYLDAGSASLFLQLVLGGFAALAVSAKLYWRRLLTFLHIRKPERRAGRERPRPPPRSPPARTGAEPSEPVVAEHAEPLAAARRRLPCRRRSRPRPPQPSRRGRSAIPTAASSTPRTASAARCRRTGSPTGGASLDSGLYAELAADERLVETEEVRRGGRARGADGPLGRRPAPRRHPVRLLPLRVDLRDAQGRGAAPARAPAGGAPARPDPEGLLALQRAVPRRPPDVHRRRLVRGPAAGRAVDRLPPVLHALPLSADAAGVPRRPVPALAARQPRRDLTRRAAQPPDASATACVAASSRTSSSTRAWRPSTPTARATSSAS